MITHHFGSSGLGEGHTVLSGTVVLRSALALIRVNQAVGCCFLILVRLMCSEWKINLELSGEAGWLWPFQSVAPLVASPASGPPLCFGGLEAMGYVVQQLVPWILFMNGWWFARVRITPGRPPSYNIITIYYILYSIGCSGGELGCRGS